MDRVIVWWVFPGLLASLASLAPAPAQVAWTRLDNETYPTPRTGHAFAFDPGRGVLVMAAPSLDATGDLETWELVAGQWQKRTLPAAPPTRSDFALAYDPVRFSVLLYGGDDLGGTRYFDTWAYDGSAWVELAPATAPREYPATMVGDPLRRRVVMLGLGRTWEWDGVDWKRVPTAFLRWSIGTAMAFDAARGSVVAFGGLDGFGGINNELWSYDGAGWTVVAANGPRPPARRGHQLVYDPVRGTLVLFGGAAATGAPVYGDTWEWNGFAWLQRAVVTAPPPAFDHAMEWAPTRGRAVAFGGIDVGVGGTALLGGTWEWDGADWSLAQAPPAPGRTRGFGLVGDAGREAVVLFGGIDGTFLARTWEWQRGVWSEVVTARAPAARVSPGMAYDARRRRVVLFGGWAQGWLADTWAYDGIDWQPVATAGAPPARDEHAIAYDPRRDRVVVFGGRQGYSQNHGDTWEFDGRTWRQRQPATSPAPRSGARMVFDPDRGTLLMVGGLVYGTGYTDEIWAWDGIDWRRWTPAASPGARADFALAVDPVRRRVVLHGGLLVQAQPPWPVVHDTWEWDGSSWTERLTTGPQLLPSAALAWDAGSRTLLRYDGFGFQTFAYGPTVPAEVSAFGQGCAGSAGVPALAAAPGSLPWTGSTFTLRATSLPALPFALLFLGSSTSIWNGLPLPAPLGGVGMPGCTLFISGDAIAPMLTVGGQGAFDLAIPATPALLGAAFHGQVLATDPAANRFGATLSNAVTATVGGR